MVVSAEEIEDGRFSGEDEKLEGEKRVLANAEKIYNAAMNAFDLLYEGVVRRLRRCARRKSRSRNSGVTSRNSKKQGSALESARISVEDVGATARDYAGGIQASPEHLARVEDRLSSDRPLEAEVWPIPG